jgi:uncharacterized protein (DUF2062 family)
MKGWLRRFCFRSRDQAGFSLAASMKECMRRLGASLTELSPEETAMLLSVGLVLGVFPIMGCPTVLCLLAAFVLRLNLVALQLLNNLTSPLQLGLLLPLVRVGAWVCRGGATASHSWTGAIGWAAVHAVAGWACVCIPLGAVLYVILVLVLRKGYSCRVNALCPPAALSSSPQ